MAMHGLGLLVMLVAVLAAPGAALACRCIWAGPFTKVALGTDLVVLAEVRSYERNSMEVEVIEVLKGKEERRALRIWGDDGALCRPYVTLFPRGTRWIFALEREREASSRDYTISGCGAFWLQVRGNQVRGSVTAVARDASAESVALPQMLAWIRSGGTSPLHPSPLH
jgi:hypothetical protein